MLYVLFFLSVFQTRQLIVVGLFVVVVGTEKLLG